MSRHPAVKVAVGPKGVTVISDARHPGWGGFVTGSYGEGPVGEVFRHGVRFQQVTFTARTPRTEAVDHVCAALHDFASLEENRQSNLSRFPVGCPHCGVGPGDPCRTGSGNRLGYEHSDRSRATAEAMSGRTARRA